MGSRTHGDAWEQHKAGYAGLKAALVLAVLTLPRPAQTHEDSEPPMALVAASLVLCSLTFAALQGSDPGYLTEDLMQQVTETEEEGEQLLATEEEDDEDEELPPSRKSAQRRYREKRIAQIEAALRQVQKTQEPDDGDREPLDLEKGGRRAGLDASAAFCAECSLFPPLRAHHCRFCAQCVATFDHHCFLLGTCIGERNHARFWWFLLLQCVELVLGVLVVVARLQPRTATSTWTQVNGWAVFVLCILCLLLLFVGSMTGFHTFLAMSSVTTYEFGRGPDRISYLRGFGECDLPFSQGLITNVWVFCCPQRSSPRQTDPHEDLEQKHQAQSDLTWRPIVWRRPLPIDREADSICENVWENKYYSCC